MVTFTEQEIQEIVNILAEAPAKYTMGVIVRLSEKVRQARLEEKQVQKAINEEIPTLVTTTTI